MKAQLIIVNGYGYEHQISSLQADKEPDLQGSPEKLIERLMQHTEPDRKFYNGYLLRLILNQHDRSNKTLFNRVKEYMKRWEQQPQVRDNKLVGIQFQLESRPA